MSNNIIKDIREEKIDANNQELFFPALIKGLLINLRNDISVRNTPVPHMILSTGTDIMFLENKGQDESKEPLEISNEDYVYNIIPRCIVKPGSIDILSDQMTNPYARGEFQLEHKETVLSVSAEMRRMPVKFTVDLTYYTDSYRDMFELVQEMISKLLFVRTYYITYLGQAIKCSYQMPDNFNEEHLIEMDGQTTDNKTRSLSISLEIETNMPIYANKTAISCDSIISNPKFIHNLT